ncbi:MAG: DUF364 domain-containing protein [Deltaproteobacteria bacterium]|nr:DUF364 domain-containing protein [Deltaproteobacteria bacterium]
MLEKDEIARRLYEYLLDGSLDCRVEDIRIGLGYAGVKLEGTMLGVAAVLRHEIAPGCSTLDRAGTLKGSQASKLLRYLIEGENPLDKIIGLATANALINMTVPEKEDDSIDLMNLSPHDHVAMVGLFKPLVRKIQDTGAELSIIERNPARAEVFDSSTTDKILKDCTVAIITATSIINSTLEDIVNRLGTPRCAVLLGPSTPLCSDIFRDTRLTHLGGSALINHDKILQIISEGGGTPLMRPYLKFVNIPIRKDSYKEEVR